MNKSIKSDLSDNKFDLKDLKRQHIMPQFEEIQKQGTNF